jgi:hypothetical protein
MSEIVPSKGHSGLREQAMDGKDLGGLRFPFGRSDSHVLPMPVI